MGGWGGGEGGSCVTLYHSLDRPRNHGRLEDECRYMNTQQKNKITAANVILSKYNNNKKKHTINQWRVKEHFRH